MRTRLSICRKKTRYRSQAEAALAALHIGPGMRTYRCERCRLFHLTSRIKGKRPPRAG